MLSRELVIIRHSYADVEVPGQGDKSRPLSSEGVAKAKRIGVELFRYPPSHILVSPAIRTLETVEHLIQQQKLKDIHVHELPVLYYGNATDYLECIQNTSLQDGSGGRIWLIGHNPMVSYLAEGLSPGFNQNFLPGMAVVFEAESSFKTAGTWRLLDIIN